jgi:serine O-acetyltransferase
MATGARRPLRIILFAQGFWASTVYRVSHRLYYANIPVPLVRTFVRFLCQISRKFMEILTGISLSPEGFVGEGLYIGHFGQVIVSPSTRIGSNCNLSQGVTLGFGGRGDRGGHPTIGNRVYIAANAVVVGKITVGDDAVIGAGAVVTKSVLPRAVIVGNPAQVASYKGSFDFIRYDGMEDDPERRASLLSQEPGGRSAGDSPAS